MTDNPTDRYVPWVGGRPSARNAGWYQDYTPLQRYSAYAVNYLGTMYAFGNGLIDDVGDESILLLAWMPHDTEAIEAVEEVIASGEYPGLNAFHNSIYGPGRYQASVNNPDADWINAMGFPKVDMALPAAYAHHMDTVFRDHDQGFGMRDFYSRQPLTVSAVENVWQEMAEDVKRQTALLMGDRAESAEPEEPAGPSTGDLFRTAYQTTHNPGEHGFFQAMQNLGDMAAPAAADLFIGGAILKGATMLAKTIQSSLAPGIAESGVIGRILSAGGTGGRSAGRAVQGAWNVRRQVALPYFLASAVGLGVSASLSGTDPTIDTSFMPQEQRDMYAQLYNQGTPAPYVPRIQGRGHLLKGVDE